MRKALDLHADPAARPSLEVLARQAGFSSSAHFSAAFREMFGMEPSRLSGGRLAA